MVQTQKKRVTPGSIIFHVAMLIGGFLLILPVLWMVSASFMTRSDVLDVPVNLLPPLWQPQNYVQIFVDFNIGLFFTNSLIVTGSVVLLNLLFCSMVGYSLAKFDFPGKNLVFLFIMATVMIPFAVIIIPLFLIVRSLDWVDTYQGLIVPFTMSAFGIFLMRQFMLGVPDDYMDAARIDGASEFGIFFRIVIPLSRPALVTLAIVTFVINWDEFLWPLVVTTTDNYRTLPIGLAKFLEAYENEWHLLMAGAVVAAMPLVLLFLVMQRRFLEGMAGLEYSVPQSTLTVCDSMPEQWSFMEVRIPMKVDGRMCWPRVLYQRKEKESIVQKTISVSGNPLTHLRVQPWLKEGAVHSAPAGYATENQGRNHIGYRFEDQPSASITIDINK